MLLGKVIGTLVACEVYEGLRGVPMLVVQGGLDFRIPLEQGLGAFTALQRRGIESQFLYFPDENHWVLKPANSILWHETVLSWLDQWTKPISSGATRR